MKNKRQTPAL